MGNALKSPPSTPINGKSSVGNGGQVMLITVRIPFASTFSALILIATFSLPGCGLSTHKNLQAPDSVHSHKIVRTAYAQVGKRYRPGGASPQKGFDCSGLVWWSYRQNGIKVPRRSTEQAKTGKKIPRRSAQPGDIVVFRTSQSPSGLHTGIYAGDGKFIHSPSSGKQVCLESLSAPSWWSDKLWTIRRPGG